MTVFQSRVPSCFSFSNVNIIANSYGFHAVTAFLYECGIVRFRLSFSSFHYDVCHGSKGRSYLSSVTNGLKADRASYAIDFFFNCLCGVDICLCGRYAVRHANEVYVDVFV